MKLDQMKLDQMRTYKVNSDRDCSQFTDACATVSLMCKESFTIEDEDVNTNEYADRWVNVWWVGYVEGPDDTIIIELEFETHTGTTAESFQSGEFDYDELLITMIDRVTHYCTEVGLYNG